MLCNFFLPHAFNGKLWCSCVTPKTISWLEFGTSIQLFSYGWIFKWKPYVSAQWWVSIPIKIYYSAIIAFARWKPIKYPLHSQNTWSIVIPEYYSVNSQYQFNTYLNIKQLIYWNHIGAWLSQRARVLDKKGGITCNRRVRGFWQFFLKWLILRRHQGPLISGGLFRKSNWTPSSIVIHFVTLNIMERKLLCFEQHSFMAFAMAAVTFTSIWRIFSAQELNTFTVEFT